MGRDFGEKTRHKKLGRMRVEAIPHAYNNMLIDSDIRIDRRQNSSKGHCDHGSECTGTVEAETVVVEVMLLPTL